LAFLTKMLYIFIFPSTHATRPPSLSSIDLIIGIIIGEEYSVRRSSLFNLCFNYHCIVNTARGIVCLCSEFRLSRIRIFCDWNTIGIRKCRSLSNGVVLYRIYHFVTVARYGVYLTVFFLNLLPLLPSPFSYVDELGPLTCFHSELQYKPTPYFSNEETTKKFIWQHWIRHLVLKVVSKTK
jgi:hypothetical protein